MPFVSELSFRTIGYRSKCVLRTIKCELLIPKTHSSIPQLEACCTVHWKACFFWTFLTSQFIKHSVSSIKDSAENNITLKCLHPVTQIRNNPNKCCRTFGQALLVAEPRDGLAVGREVWVWRGRRQTALPGSSDHQWPVDGQGENLQPPKAKSRQAIDSTIWKASVLKGFFSLGYLVLTQTACTWTIISEWLL